VSGGRVWCGKEMLANNMVYYSDYPSNQRVCMYSIDPIFGNTTGYWEAVGSCNSDDCTLSYTLSEGVILTDTQSLSMTYAHTLSTSTSEHMNFFGLGASHTTTTTTSRSITRIVSKAYSRQYARAATVTCKGKVMYQWVQSTDK